MQLSHDRTRATNLARSQIHAAARLELVVVVATQIYADVLCFSGVVLCFLVPEVAAAFCFISHRVGRALVLLLSFGSRSFCLGSSPLCSNRCSALCVPKSLLCIVRPKGIKSFAVHFAGDYGCSCCCHSDSLQMAPRWKGKDAKAKKDAEAEALKEPMSKTISQLQFSLAQSDTCGMLSASDNAVRVIVGAEQIDLLDKACFGRPVSLVEKDKQCFQFSLEEAFYLCYSLKCLKIIGGDSSPQTNEELWHHLKSKKEEFPYFFKAYSHLRTKNWVVRPGYQYGVDFIVYRHHPSRVHSEYGILVSTGEEDNEDVNGRLRVWSDIHCTTRLLGGVAKTLLVLYINTNGCGDDSPTCMANYTVQEHTISRWSPELCRGS